MTAFSIVLLSADAYLDKNQQSPLINNVRWEDGLVANALEEEGITVTIKSWSDSSYDWSSPDFILVRTPWDYFERSEQFIKWFTAASAKTTFINSAELITWNFDKNYLKQLKSKGIHIPKTYFIQKGSDLTLESALKNAEHSFGQTCSTWVVKPCIAAGAFHTYKFEAKEKGNYEYLFQKLIRTGDYMLQEFQENIVAKGEVSLVFFGTTFSHAILKNAKSGDFRVQDDYGGTVRLYKASQQEIKFGLEVLKACDELPIYSRVDIFEDNEGKLALAELEIFEPELWFRLQPNSAAILAKTIKMKYFA